MCFAIKVYLGLEAGQDELEHHVDVEENLFDALVGDEALARGRRLAHKVKLYFAIDTHLFGIEVRMKMTTKSLIKLAFSSRYSA